MDIKWKDGEGNILNADNKSIRYFEAKDKVKTVLKKEEVMKITIEDGMMHIFKDFRDDLALTIVIPRKRTREATNIFNAYDKTGAMLKRKSNDFFLNLILESSIILYSPFIGISVIITTAAILALVLFGISVGIFGEYGVAIAVILIISYPIYSLLSYIHLRIDRKRIAKKSIAG